MAFAEQYPGKPIKLVVPFPVGGATDVVARHFSAFLAAKLGHPLVVENRPVLIV
jgi:tripartite-type tricarboxylate transporter receptor subunit TctC